MEKMESAGLLVVNTSEKKISQVMELLLVGRRSFG